MNQADVEKWFEHIWTDREEKHYPAFFGPLESGMFPLPSAVFARLGKPDPDPRFLTHGVLVSPPNPKRASWLYVTSGMSNPWGSSPETVNPEEYSGLGFEFVLEAPTRAAWPVAVLHWLMAVQLMVATGDVGGELVAYHDRVPIGMSIDAAKSELHTLLLCQPDTPCLYPANFALPSGKVDLMLCLGITQREREFANAQGTPGLIDLLLHRGAFPLTDPARAGVV